MEECEAEVYRRKAHFFAESPAVSPDFHRSASRRVTLLDPELPSKDTAMLATRQSRKTMPENGQLFEFETQGNVLILTPRGSMMEYRDAELRNAYNEAYRRLMAPEIDHMMIDFSAMDYFGSTFVGMLIRLARKVRSDGGEAALCHLSESMEGMMKQLMLLENQKTDCYWIAFDTRDAALAQLPAQK